MSMASSYRNKSCIYLNRSWRPGSSCLRCPRLLIILSIVYVLLQDSQAKFSHNTSTFYTFSCTNRTWCGETWAPNRILRYHYNLTEKLVQDTFPSKIHENNCSGVQDSQGCSTQTVNKNQTTKRRVKVTQRSTHPEITSIPISNLYDINTDSINDSSSTNETYPANQDKIWQLSIPRGCKMTVYFSKFDLEVSERCEKDNFTVQTNKNQREIYKYCNDLHRIEIKRRRRVQMVFHSDAGVEMGGIKAVACISNLIDASSEDELDKRFPCTCNRSGSTRRKKSSLDRASQNHLKRKIAEENTKVEAWLHTLMAGGQEAIDSILREAENPKQRHLAEQYQTILSKHRKW